MSGKDANELKNLESKLKTVLEKFPKEFREQIRKKIEVFSHEAAQREVFSFAEKTEDEINSVNILKLLNEEDGVKKVRDLCQKHIDHEELVDALGSIDFYWHNKNFPSFDERK